MPLQQPIDVGTRRGQLCLDEADRLGTEAFVIVKADDPIVGALRHREGARLFHCRRPWNYDDPIGVRRGKRDSTIGG